MIDEKMILPLCGTWAHISYQLWHCSVCSGILRSDDSDGDHHSPPLPAAPSASPFPSSSPPLPSSEPHIWNSGILIKIRKHYRKPTIKQIQGLFSVNSVREVTKVSLRWTSKNWNELKLLNRYQFYQFIFVKTGMFSNILLLWFYWSYWMATLW